MQRGFLSLFLFHTKSIWGIGDVVDFAVVFSTGKVTKGPLSQEETPTTGNP